MKALNTKSPDDADAKPILDLIKAVDEYIPTPVRDLDKPFLMPIEDVFSIEGRGTVVTGRVERGKVKVNDEVELVGLKPTTKTVVTGIEMFQKTLDEGLAGDNVGVSAPRPQERGRGARPGGRKAGQCDAAFRF